MTPKNVVSRPCGWGRCQGAGDMAMLECLKINSKVILFLRYSQFLSQDMRFYIQVT